MVALLQTTLIATALLLLVRTIHKRWRYSSLKSRHQCEDPPQYPHKDPILGFDLMSKINKSRKENRSLDFVFDLHEANGKTFEVTSMGSRVVYTIEPENLRVIFSTQSSHWGVQPLRLPAMDYFCGKGFMTVDGDLWHHSRRMFQPSFEKKAIADFSAIEKFTQQMMLKLPQNEHDYVDMQPLLSSLFVNVTTLFLFGESFDDFSEDYVKEISGAFDQAMFGSGVRIALGPLRFLGKTSQWKEACKYVQDFADVYVERALEYRASPERQKTASKKGNVLLYNLAEQIDDKEHLRNEIIQAFFASQSTTANLVSAVLFAVSRLPDIWCKLREEVLTSNFGSEKAPTYEQLQRLSYLRNVCNEALRLYPVLPNNSRVALTNTVLPTGGGKSGQKPIYIEAGTKVSVNYYTLHRRKDIWGEDALTFNPDRWSFFDSSPSYYLPFGIGLRQCIGRDKSLIEATYVLTRLIQRFERIESRDDNPWQGHVSLTCCNANGCKVAFF